MNKVQTLGAAAGAAAAGAAWLLTLTPTAFPGKLYKKQTIRITFN